MDLNKKKLINKVKLKNDTIQYSIMSLREDLILLNTVTDIKTRQQFKEFINPNKAYFVYFTATWCKYCKIARPKVIEYLKLLKSKGVNLQFLLLDADESRDVVRHLKVKAFPTTLCIINNQVEDICVGGGDEDLHSFFNSSYEKLK